MAPRTHRVRRRREGTALRDGDENLTTAIRQLERGLDGQKEAVDHLSGKAAVVLGLAASALIAIAGLDRPTRTFNGDLAAAMVSSYKRNERRLDAQFHLLNRGIAWFLVGIVIYGAGVGFR